MELQSLNVSELSSDELIIIEGGILPIVYIGLAGLYLASTVCACYNGCNPHTGRKM